MSEQGQPNLKTRKKVRLSHVVFLLICFCVALALAWWQWSRFQSGSGTFQNLGYAFQWPVIGGFLIYAYRKYLEYENQSIDKENLAVELARHPDADNTADTTAEGTALPAATPEATEDFMISNRPSLVDNSDQVTEIDDTFLPDRPALDVEEFNRLNDPTRRRRRRD
ncbi:hypothetical protein [Corynebacterium faecale]|uniref:hypothetical protein n=1 Tax=Corynebacterium faecale TaxID=1758466 RepID=UPI0025B56B35|nr:hypothetical protein [Corynebacterium faecale]